MTDPNTITVDGVEVQVATEVAAPAIEPEAPVPETAPAEEAPVAEAQ